ncbi:cytosine/adenosine deaminase [Owenweeksia hongkongensis DSM 17368]|uniref:Cytosine/adenosine deaminase n=1 Tax=Owenweeksia hongkongensis (strain DSM 17368 / CIP 108786 / JCM 12287 / NRRL B-23963 / UST20020801) TaxID=926562 RepID=G8R7F5_OWEHD|nr:nucleoside deaminase [Owenweeksia hongkongensis]AEV31266.1 cytosine/adenosine deaminase [Owenweeksia hongkongensis DSM 17368]
MNDELYIRLAIEFSQKGMDSGSGGPFGCVIVKDGEVIGHGYNQVTTTNDPTAHAEIVAIRNACKAIDSFQLEGCVVYTSCEPCPMCLGAIYWARPDRLVYACSRQDAAAIGFDDDFIYQEIPLQSSERKIKTEQLLQEEGVKVMELWKTKKDKIDY